MARKPLRSQLNQIRAWAREGRTDAWIAHQIDVSASELREFRRRHGLSSEGGEEVDADLRDEIEAEIEAAALEEEEPEDIPEEAPEERGEGEGARGEGDEVARGEPGEGARGEGGDGARGEGEGDGSEDAEGEERPGERRGRRRRRRRRRRRKPAALQGTFDHGETDGFGLWLDPAIQDEPLYAEHWAGHRAVEVEVEADRIVIKRSE